MFMLVPKDLLSNLKGGARGSFFFLEYEGLFSTCSGQGVEQAGTSMIQEQAVAKPCAKTLQAACSQTHICQRYRDPNESTHCTFQV